MSHFLQGIRGFAAWCAVLVSVSARAQDIVYEVPDNPAALFTYSYINHGTEYGDGAQLGGTSRYAKQMTVPVYSDVDRTVTVTASIYATAPFDASWYPPGTQLSQPGTTVGPVDAFQPAASALWTSGPVTFSLAASDPFTPSFDYLIFNNINTLLPDTVFWSVQFNSVSSHTSGSGGFGLIYRNADEITISGAGTDASRFYLRDPSVTTLWTPAFLTATPATYSPPITSTFGVQITAVAVPEASSSLLTLCAAGLMFRRRRA